MGEAVDSKPEYSCNCPFKKWTIDILNVHFILSSKST
jgi:hypothetical protein